MFICSRFLAKHLMLILIIVLALVCGVNAVVLTEVLVNSATTPGSELPSMDYNATSGRMVAVWHGFYESSPGDVWFQRLDQDLAKIGDITLVGDDLYYSGYGDPAVAATGDFAITFRGQATASDARNVYISFFNADGTPKGASIKVTDDGIEGSQGESQIATDSAGNVIVVWDDGRDKPERSSGDIWAQFFSASGAKIGTNRRVSDDLDTCCVGLPKVSMNSSGEAVITWQANMWSGDAYTYNGKDIRFQKFLVDGSKVDPIGTANFPTSDTKRREPTVSINHSGSFSVVWEEPNADAIVVQFYNFTGATVGSNIRIERTEGPEGPAISLTDNNTAVLSWDEDRIFYQVFQDATLSGDVEMVIDLDRYDPSVGTNSNDIFFLYQGPYQHPNYWPVFVAKLSDGLLPSCCINPTGDFDNNGNAIPDINDLLYLVDYMFLPPGSAPEPFCMEEANVDGLGEAVPNIADLLYLVDYMFLPPGTAPEPADCL